MLLKLSATSMALLCFIASYSQGVDSVKKAPATPDSPVAAAAKTPPPVTITGSVDVYYRLNSGSGGSKYTNNYTSFTNSVNSFELGMASIRADHSFGDVSATVDLGF